MRSTLLHIDAIRPDPDNPNCRKVLRGIPALAESIRASGQLQPISVRPDPGLNGSYLILFGHRRYAACKLAGIENIRCEIMHSNVSKIDISKVRLIENIYQEPMTPVERARAFDELKRSSSPPMSNLALSTVLHVSEGTIRRYLMILDLDASTIQKIEDGKIRWTDAIAHVAEVRALRRGFSKEGKKAAKARPVPMSQTQFTRHHPLAGNAQRRCVREGHLVPSASVACFGCIETTIRLDERAKMAPASLYAVRG